MLIDKHQAGGDHIEQTRTSPNYHSFLWVDTPVSEGDVGNHSTNKANPIKRELGQWCHGHTCILFTKEGHARFVVPYQHFNDQHRVSSYADNSNW